MVCKRFVWLVWLATAGTLMEHKAHYGPQSSRRCGLRVFFVLFVFQNTLQRRHAEPEMRFEVCFCYKFPCMSCMISMLVCRQAGLIPPCPFYLNTLTQSTTIRCGKLVVPSGDPGQLLPIATLNIKQKSLLKG